MDCIEVIDTSSGPDQAAHDILVRTLIKDGMISISIDVELIAQKLDVTFMRLDLDEGVGGLLVRNTPHEPFCAVIDSKAPSVRARFTLAHALGHYIHSYQNLGDGEVAGIIERRDALSSRRTDPEEIWANSFAAAPLMPAQVVARLWADNCSIGEMADGVYWTYP